MPMARAAMTVRSGSAAGGACCLESRRNRSRVACLSSCPPIPSHRVRICPGHQVPGGGEAGHIQADLGDDGVRGGQADPGDLVELAHRGRERGDLLFEACVSPR